MGDRTSVIVTEYSSGFELLVSSVTRAFHLVLEPYSKSKSCLNTDSVSLPPFLFVNRLSHHMVKCRSSIMVGIDRSLSALDGMLRSIMNCLLIVV